MTQYDQEQIHEWLEIVERLRTMRACNHPVNPNERAQLIMRAEELLLQLEALRQESSRSRLPFPRWRPTTYARVLKGIDLRDGPEELRGLIKAVEDTATAPRSTRFAFGRSSRTLHHHLALEILRESSVPKKGGPPG